MIFFKCQIWRKCFQTTDSYLKSKNSQNSKDVSKKHQNKDIKNLLHKINKNTGKIVRVNIFKTLENNQRLAAILEELIQEKWLNHKTSKLCDILFRPIPIHPPQPHSFESQPIFHTSRENHQPGSYLTGAEESGSIFTIPFPEDCHYSTYLVVS